MIMRMWRVSPSTRYHRYSRFPSADRVRAGLCRRNGGPGASYVNGVPITSVQPSDYFFGLALPALGLLAPYLERLCILLATPAVSRVPRTMW